VAGPISAMVSAAAVASTGITVTPADVPPFSNRAGRASLTTPQGSDPRNRSNSATPASRTGRFARTKPRPGPSPSRPAAAN